MEIADRRVATVHFTLTDEQGNQVTSTRGHDPLVHMQGTGGIVPALEEALEGKQAGDRFEVTVSPEHGFGPRFPALEQTIPRAVYTGSGEPAVGEKLQATTEQGSLEVRVTAVDEDNISVDGNHPLAGQSFKLDVEVVDVRMATPDEIQFGVNRPG